MLDGLLGNGLSSKCKSSIKVINSRLVLIKRKRSSILRFLRKDVADLLSSGQELKAFDRVEILIAEQNLSTAYDMIEQFCGAIVSNLKAIRKKRHDKKLKIPRAECPPESIEAVVSLMFAAARFADLPELRNLRTLFTQRYGSALAYDATGLEASDSCVNPEFAEIISSTPHSTEKKLNLMREIAKESSIKWDSMDFEEKIANLNASENEGAITDGCIDDHVSNQREDTDALAYTRIEPHWEHSKKSEQLWDSAANEYDQGSELPVVLSTMPECVWDESPEKKYLSRVRHRRTEIPTNHSAVPECMWDESPERKDSSKARCRRTKIPECHERKSDDLGKNIVVEKEDPEMLCHIRRKTPYPYGAPHKLDDSADESDDQETFPNRRRSLNASWKPEKRGNCNIDGNEDQGSTHMSKSPCGSNITVDARNEGICYERNENKAFSHIRIPSPVDNHQEGLSHGRKPSCYYNKTSNSIVESKCHEENGEDENSTCRRKSPLGTKRIDGKFGGDDHEIFSRRTRPSAVLNKNGKETHRRDKHEPSAHRSEASFHDVKDSEELDRAEYKDHLNHTKEIEEKPKSIWNLKPPYVISKGHRFTYDHQTDIQSGEKHVDVTKLGLRKGGEGNVFVDSRVAAPRIATSLLVKEEPKTEFDSLRGSGRADREVFKENGGNGVHVHPKLPDYDDLTVRFAALKKGIHA